MQGSQETVIFYLLFNWNVRVGKSGTKWAMGILLLLLVLLLLPVAGLLFVARWLMLLVRLVSGPLWSKGPPGMMA
jgi:hypothetical protein